VRVIKGALIGAGQIARLHLGCLESIPGVEIAAVCDLSPSVARAAAERHGATRWFTDYRAMLAEVRPDVVHVTTPPTSHFRLAMDALAADAHVIVEKPATVTLGEVEALLARAAERRRSLLEDYNYLYSAATLEIRRLIDSGDLGNVVHVDVAISLNILGPSGFADPNSPHPCLTMAGGAIADFLPHLASLAQLFIGFHTRAQVSWRKRADTILPYDEFHALVDGERATASLAFSSTAQPDAFWLRVYGERMLASANLFEKRFTIERLRSGPKPLQPLRNGLDEGRAIRKAAMGTLWRKFRGGPGSYDGLYELLTRTYRSLGSDAALPVTAQQVLEVNRLVDALKPAGQAA
jgi:predicted dehydrogenase